MSSRQASSECRRVKVSIEISLAERVMSFFGCQRMEKILVVVVRMVSAISSTVPDSRYQPNKVSRISRPAAKIGSSLVLCVVSHVKAAEHMAEIDFVTIWQRELLNVFQSRCIGAILLVLIGNIG